MNCVSLLLQVELTEYTVTSVTEGIDAQASTRVSIRPVGRMANEGFVIHAQVCNCCCRSAAADLPKDV